MGSPYHQFCPVSKAMELLDERWTLLVVRELLMGSERFNELRRSVDAISQRMLTLTLRGLERDGLVTRTVTPTTPPRVDYGLTRLGSSLLDPIMALADWAESNRSAIRASRQRFDETDHLAASASRTPRTPIRGLRGA